MKQRVTIVLAAIAALAAGAAQAGQCGYEYCWGAVGIGPGGAWGYAHGYSSESGAWNRTQQECGGDCTNIRTFYNTCGALAEGSQGNWGFGWAGSRSQAEQNALGFCYQNGPNCSVRVWACSP